MRARSLLVLSRPRFWLYLAGSYLVGYAFGSNHPTELLEARFLVHLGYFLLPANLFLYGINDLFDRDTDAGNPKKGAREHLLADSETRSLAMILVGLTMISTVLVFVQPDWTSIVILIGFVVLSSAYSAPPVRFKAHPFVDSLSNVLYAMPGLLGFQHAAGALPPTAILAAAWAWTAAMHLLSAIPDIDADHKVGLNTTAVVLGHNWSLVVCLVLWTTAAVLTTAHVWWGVFGLVYPLIPLGLLLIRRWPVERAYWYFPFINATAGFGLWIAAALPLIRAV